MIAWFIRHLQTLIGSLGRLSQHWLATTLTMVVMGLALALPAFLHLLVTNAQQATGGWNRQLSLTVFLKRPTSVDEARRLADGVRRREEVAEVQLITAEQALKDFRRESGLGAAIDALNDNPLPHALTVRPAPDFATAERLQILAADLQSLPSVQLVQLDTAWVNRLNAILDAARRGVMVGAALLALGVLLIVGNTIRLDIQNRREEIEVTKLVGGSNAFVRRPFLYAGVWYGIGGGLLAWGLTTTVAALLAQPVARIANLYGSGFRLAGLGLQPSMILLASGVFLGWLGSYLAATRHLRSIEPS
jgi:cell division transport system permease protein